MITRRSITYPCEESAGVIFADRVLQKIKIEAILNWINHGMIVLSQVFEWPSAQMNNAAEHSLISNLETIKISSSSGITEFIGWKERDDDEDAND